MTSTVKIDLDLDVVQKAVHAKIAPAVEKILAKVDLPAKIEAALLEKPKGDRSRYMMPALYYTLGDYGPGRPAIDDLVDRAIHDAAKKYVETAVKRERGKLEAAFEKMLRESGSKLAHVMVESLTSSLKNDWRFEIDTRVTPKEPEQIDYRD